jgi:hypothetical protein
MAKDRSRDDRRSVGSFEKMKGALGKAAGWTRHTDSDLGTFAFKADEQGNVKFPTNYRVGKDAAFPIGRSSATRYNSVAAIERARGGQPSEPEKRAVENKNKMMKGPSDPSVVKINTNPVK